MGAQTTYGGLSPIGGWDVNPSIPPDFPSPIGQKGDNMAFYRVDIVTSAAGNEWINSMYYEFEGSVLGAWFGADELAERAKAVLVPAFKGAMSKWVRVEKVRVTPFDDNFSLKMFQPYELAVGQSGEVDGIGDPLPPEQVVILRYNLFPVDRFALASQPRRGRLYLSGLHEGQWNYGVMNETFADEIVPGSFRNRLKNLCTKLAQPLGDSVLPDWVDSGGFEPVRAKWNKIAGGIVKVIGYSRVQSVTYSTRITYLRPRGKN